MLSSGCVRLAVKARAWTPTQKEWMLAAQCIQLEEKERIAKFVFKKDAKSAVVGRLLIRRVVSSALGIPYRCVKLGRTERGKPYILSPIDGKTTRLGLNFNISHQGDYVVLAADPDNLVGVDIMKVEWNRPKLTIQDFLKTMEGQLTDREWATVRRYQGDSDQLKAFYRYWCLKESYVKALGVGIGFKVSLLDFDTGGKDLSPVRVNTSTTLKVEGVPVSDWTFEETMLEDHCVAVATRHDSVNQSGDHRAKSTKRTPEQFTVWTIPQLLSGCEPLLGSEPDPAYWNNFQAKDEAPTLT